ncbi:FAD-dependent oxidoreductase [Haliea sp. E17]|uniref:FAD-dependent oxidoreductase n=1 Tax=Haliea sp. E17 TaxID=3401576 RepID=UPI003AACE434
MSGSAFDFVVVGSGAGGLAAAITARLNGLHPLLIEKTALVGGSSVMSGGVMWLPDNPLMRREGIADSREQALEYLANFVGPEEGFSTPARREAYVDNIAPMMDLMEAQGMQYLRCPGYSDYYDTLPGGNGAGRSIQAELYNANRLGSWKSRLRLPYVALPVRTSEGARLMSAGTTLAGKWMLARVGARLVAARLTGRQVFGSGGALQGRMLEIALRLGVEIWTETGLHDLDLRGGKVEGIHVHRDGKSMTIAAPRGVLICAGGFSRNAPMRQQHQRHPIGDAWTHANPGDTGESIEVMRRAGAGLAMMQEAWWVPTWVGPERIEQIIPELARPHGILVDHAGERMVNEANSYMEIGRAMYQRHAKTPAIPAWVVMDARARKKYMFALKFPGKMPADWLESGCIRQDNSIAGLATQCGIDPAGLEKTVARFNHFATAGRDEDFGRGASAYNRYYGDSANRPNPCLGTIENPPFWAAPLYPGDVGTCGGAVTNERAEVLRPDGSAIPGLYAAGNSAASLCGPHYVGAGQSIGCSSVFGFIAANCAADKG